MRPIDIFHIGPQKSGTTWLYENVKQHPEIASSKIDSVHYFDMHFAKGEKWLESHFPDIRDGQKIFDPTPSYMRSPFALERILEHNPKAKIALTLRHPVERAYSHYWHERKKGIVLYEFSECLKNYDLFQNWLEPGLPNRALKFLNDHIDQKNLHIIMYEDIRDKPRQVLENIFRFWGVDDSFKTAEPEKPVNVAGSKRDTKTRVQDKIGRVLRLDELAPDIYARMTGRDQYKKGIEPELREELVGIIKPMVLELQDLSGKDLSHWLETPSKQSNAG